MKDNSIIPKLKEKLALDEKTEDCLGREYAENFETTEMLQAYSHYLAGLNMESARLTDVHRALVNCVEALEKIEFYVGDHAQILAEQALQHLREVLDESPK